MRTEGEAGSRRIWRYRRGESGQSFCFVPRREFRRGALLRCLRVALLRSCDAVMSGFELLDSGPMASFPLRKYVACFKSALSVSPTRVGRNKDYDAGSAASRYSFYRFRHPLSPNGTQQRGSREERGLYVELSRPWLVSALHSQTSLLSIVLG